MWKMFPDFSELFQHSLLANVLMHANMESRCQTQNILNESMVFTTHGLFGTPGCICAFSQTLKERVIHYAVLWSPVPICHPLCAGTALLEQPGSETEAMYVPNNRYTGARLQFGYMEPISF